MAELRLLGHWFCSKSIFNGVPFRKSLLYPTLSSPKKHKESGKKGTPFVDEKRFSWIWTEGIKSCANHYSRIPSRAWVSKFPNEKEAIYGALDKWCAWETEFPVIAAAKALEILRRRNQWLRIIQVTKWLLSKSQVLTMGTFDTLLLALDMDQRVGEAETIWNVILQTHTRSVPKRLFSRMISLYDHHHVPEKIVEVFADMEEVGVKPDNDTVRRIARAFEKLGQVENQKLLLKRYQNKWKYLHFNGERVRVRNPEYPND